MKRFYEFYAIADKKLRQLVAVLPWKHNLLIMSSSSSIDEARYYVEVTYENCLSRNVLNNLIKTDSFKNIKLLPKHNNFANTLPEHLQEQANEILKSTYNLEMLGLKYPLKERELELSLVQDLLLLAISIVLHTMIRSIL